MLRYRRFRLFPGSGCLAIEQDNTLLPGHSNSMLVPRIPYSVKLLVKDTGELADRIPNQSPPQDCTTSPDHMVIETSSTSSSPSSKKHKSGSYPTELFEYDEHVPLVFIQNPANQESVEWTRFRDACKLFVNARQVETTPPEWSIYQLGSEQTIATGHPTVKNEQTAPRGYCGEKSQKGTEQDTGAIFVQEAHPNNSDVSFQGRPQLFISSCLSTYYT
ncbi:hypothetical protein P879_03395 [Paragonimus westermani]|uniref:Uncharacterized protein n=1 Tax=Paragonimus westermani TaxID=34504 RepID=A0A8T0DU90_9TREM|nr:hypothetical protein P879_03395 [Paragonimus westermani]